MNEIVNTFLLTEDKIMPEMYLKQPRFTYSALWSIYEKQRKNSKIHADRKYTIV